MMSEEMFVRMVYGFFSIIGLIFSSLALHTSRALITDYEPPRGSLREDAVLLCIVPTVLTWLVVGVAVVAVVSYFIGSLVLRLLGMGVV